MQAVRNARGVHGVVVRHLFTAGGVKRRRSQLGVHGVVVWHRVVPALDGGEERAHAVGADAERRAHAVPFEQCPAEGGECVAAR